MFVAFCLAMFLWADQPEAQPAAAGDASKQASEIAHAVMSPFCPGLTLAACPSGRAADLRKEIRARVADGETPEAIIESLVARFGESVRGTPKPTGLGLALWAVPAALGVALLRALVAAGGLARAPLVPATHPAESGAKGQLRLRLDEELELLD